ncbi:expressed protein, partial [Arabidopsis lyrata subsp. lyrata]
ITMTESKKCHKDSDCKHKIPCAIPVACLYGGCVCTLMAFANRSFSACKLMCAQLGKNTISHFDSSHCVCGDK